MEGTVKISKRNVQRVRRDGQIVQATAANVYIVGGSSTSSSGGVEVSTAQDLLNLLLEVDGSGSGLDADLLDGYHATDFAPVAHIHDDRYYTESEVNAALALKADIDSPEFTGTVTVEDLVVLETAQIDEIVSSDYTSGGFAGSGHRLAIVSGESILEVDKLVVRGSMDTYELIIHKLRATNGALMVAPGAKVLSGISQDENGYYITVKAEEQVFAAGDIIKAQKFVGTGTYSRSYKVASVSGGKVYITTVAGGAPTVIDVNGEEYVRMGNASDTDRQGSLYLSSDDTGAPFLKVFDGVDSDTFDATDAKVILGKLTGSGKSFAGSAIEGYGLYAENAYITGKISGQLLYIDSSSVARDIATTLPSAALVGNPNLIRDGWRSKTGNGYPLDQQDNIVYLTAGRTYTFSVRGRKVSGTSNRLSVFLFDSTWASTCPIDIPETSLITKKATFVPNITGIYHVGCYSMPAGNGGDCEVLWTMLQEGDVYVDQNTVFKQTAEESVKNLENLLEDSVTRSFTAPVGQYYYGVYIASVSILPDHPSAQPVLQNGKLYSLSFANVALSHTSLFSIRIFNFTDSTWDNSPYINDAVPIGSNVSVRFRLPADGKNYGLAVYAGVRSATVGTITLSNIMLQEGPFSTPWRYAVTETAEAMAAGLEAKAKTEGFSVIVNGLITTNVIKLGDTEGNETAGINGIPRVGGYCAPAFYCGGSLADAVGGDATTILYHNGLAKIARMTISPAGDLDIKNADNSGYIQITPFNIIDLASLEASSVDVTKIPATRPQGSGVVTGEYTWDSSAVTDGFYAVTNNNTKLTIAASLWVEIANGGADYENTSWIDFYIYLVGPGSTETLLDQVSLMQYMNGTVNNSITVGHTMFVGTGTYYLKTRAVVYREEPMTVSYNALSMSLRFEYDSTWKFNVTGKNGDVLSKGGNNFFRRAINDDGELDVDVKTEGKFNIPGVLAAGRVSLSGGLAKSFGSFAVTSIDHPSTGVYTCTLPAPTHDFIPVVSAISATPGMTAQVDGISTSGVKAFQVSTHNAAGTLVNCDFSFAVLGNNQ